MTPTVPAPPSTCHSCAGADPRGAESGCRSKWRRSVVEDGAGADGLVALPLVAGVQRHLLDDAQLVSVLEAEAQQRHGVVEARDRIQHGVHLHRGQTGRGGGGQTVEHVGEPVAPGDAREALRVDGVQ